MKPRTDMEKPKMKTAIDQTQSMRIHCDNVIKFAIHDMLEAGLTMEVIIDRLATYAAFAMVTYGGKAHAVEEIRKMADTIEAGLFDNLDGERGHG